MRRRVQGSTKRKMYKWTLLEACCKTCCTMTLIIVITNVMWKRPILHWAAFINLGPFSYILYSLLAHTLDLWPTFFIHVLLTCGQVTSSLLTFQMANHLDVSVSNTLKPSNIGQPPMQELVIASRKVVCVTALKHLCSNSPSNFSCTILDLFYTICHPSWDVPC